MPGFPVTDDLFNALRILRQSTYSRALWVDAICINQAYIHERSTQVSIMGEIYRSATNILVWLWDCTDLDRLELEKSSGRHVGAGSFERGRDVLLAFVFAIRETKPSWWPRKWVVQEVVQAQHPARFYFGDCNLDFSYLEMVGPGTMFVEAGHFVDAFNQFSELRKMIRQPKERLDLSDAILRIISQDATDPRDRIYSLLSFTESRPRVSARIQPDYSLSTVDVFAKATYHLIQTTKSLSILCTAPFGLNGVAHSRAPLRDTTGAGSGGDCALMQ